MDNTLQRDTRLDLAKGTAILLVLFWHLQPIQMSTTDKSTIFIKILELGLTQFNLQISLVAVPVFLLVSLYLFFQKIDDRALEGMKKRCLRVGGVYLFWSACQFAFFYGIMSIISNPNSPSNLSLPIPINRLLMEGGPPLPIVGGSVFYFLFVLFILVLVSTVFFLFRNFKRLFPLIGVAVVIVSIIYFETLNLYGRGLPYWRIENFLIYIPLSYFLLKQENGKLVRNIPFFYLGFFLFSAQDVFLRNHGYNCGAYSRISIVFGSIALFSTILKLKGLNKNTAITFLSKYSLGIFATHKYWQLIVILSFHYCGIFIPTYAAGFPFNIKALTIAFVAMLLTLCGVLLGGRTRITRFIT